MKKNKKRTPVLPTEHTPDALQVREYADTEKSFAEFIKKNQQCAAAKVAEPMLVRNMRLTPAGSILKRPYEGHKSCSEKLEHEFKYKGKR